MCNPERSTQRPEKRRKSVGRWVTGRPSPDSECIVHMLCPTPSPAHPARCAKMQMHPELNAIPHSQLTQRSLPCHPQRRPLCPSPSPFSLQTCSHDEIRHNQGSHPDRALIIAGQPSTRTSATAAASFYPPCVMIIAAAAHPKQALTRGEGGDNQPPHRNRLRLRLSRASLKCCPPYLSSPACHTHAMHAHTYAARLPSRGLDPDAPHVIPAVCN